MGSRTLGDINSYLPAVKLLAYENANRSCQEVLCLHRNKDLDDFIHLCRGVVPSTVMGQVVTSAPREVAAKTGSKNCFQCGKPGHIRKDCPAIKGVVDPSRSSPGVCPRCQKGTHWASNCWSKTDSQGIPLPVSKNGRRGRPRALKTQAYGAMSVPNAQIRFVPQRRASLSANLPKAPQEAQD